MDAKKVVLILSGGLDSSTLLYKLLDEGNEVTALSFNYGQKAAIEIERASEICAMNNVSHRVFDIRNIVDLLSSSLTDEDNDNVSEPINTVVPSRNTILLELATAFAISNDLEEVYYGAIKADVGDYPDTTPEFLNQINELNKVNNYEYIPIRAPFIDTDKKDVVKIAIELGVPIEKTWSCYVNDDGTPCGECFSCKSRIKAIEEAKKELGID
ncbi:7-cyano-7-deazaguanine synthase QueC [uncultured Methanobrevibacter sp.]|uniref:7-cyano-7-deazaguanine synthase QueC n=1 Tax=uncultured Methanobrevibacter sp. TaxID=253161 RepID=UPI0026040B17